MRVITAKQVWTSSGWVRDASVVISNGTIQEISPGVKTPHDVPLLIPGMIELHVHGSFGYSVKDPDENKMRNWLRLLATHGVTGVLVSPSTAPAAVMSRAVATSAQIMMNPRLGESRVLGVHLEGPFINPKRKGGMNAEHILPPTIHNYHLITGGLEKVVKLVTLAPEMDGADELTCSLVTEGVHVSAGHSDATYEEMLHAIDLGVDGVTHFFNATRPIHHRDAGLLIAAILTPNVICELVGDLVHVKPEIIRFMLQSIGSKRIALVTDAVPLTGMPDGVYGDELIVKNGSPQKLNGTLSGGKMLMDEVLRAMIYAVGIDPWDAVCMVSHTPALRMGLERIGDIRLNFSADLVALDENYRVIYSITKDDLVP